MRKPAWALALLLLAATPAAHSYDNGLGLTPPMGFNTWNTFRCNYSADTILEVAQQLVDLGLRELGYVYMNLDDCWQVARNATGYIIEDPKKFPQGMMDFRMRIQDMGLKFGLYSDAGIMTCQGRPGGLGYEVQDATMYGNVWKIDYLKYDNCFNMHFDVHVRYQRMHDALNTTGRPIFFSMCEWGQEDVATWATPVGNSWRTTGDIGASWRSMTINLDENDQWHDYAGPGGWNDPDMLEVGNSDFAKSVVESKSHFTLWCLIKSPLLLGNDLRSMSPEILEIISNKEVIAWNQDRLGVQGYKRKSEQDLEIWAGPLSGNNRVAVVLFNRSEGTANMTLCWEDVSELDPTAKYTVRDVWEHQNLGTFSQRLSVEVKSHGIVALQMQVPDVKRSSSLRKEVS